MKYIALTLLVLSSLIALGQKKELKLNLVTGQDYYLDQVSSINIISEVAGTKSEVEMVFFGKMKFAVKAIKGEVFTMDVKYESMGLNMKVLGQEINGSSDDTSTTNKFSNLLSSMTHGTFEMDLTNYGEVKDIRGADEMLIEAVQSMEDLSEAEREQMYAQMSPSFGEKAIEGSMELFTLIYPGRSVNVGEKWKTKTKLSGQVSANVENSYTYSSSEDAYDVITGLGDIGFSDSEKSTINGVEYTYVMSGEVQTEFKIDPKTGWILSAKYDQFFDGHMLMSANGEEMKVPMTFRTNILCK